MNPEQSRADGVRQPMDHILPRRIPAAVRQMPLHHKGEFKVWPREIPFGGR